ncbi:MAG: OmpA family protein [Pseudomonadota bacterium]
MLNPKILPALAATALVVAGCSNELGIDGQSRSYGLARAHNSVVQVAYGDPSARLRNLSEAFKAATTDTVTFAFNQSSIDPQGRQVLDSQAKWLEDNPSVRMTVIGHTDLVGGESYNNRLGLRRARSVVRYLSSKGISRKRLDAVESRGEREPVVQTQERERRNRRAITMVAGFDRRFVGSGLDGEYAAQAFDTYQGGRATTTEADSTDTGG